jgi:hypothetical protein
MGSHQVRMGWCTEILTGVSLVIFGLTRHLSLNTLIVEGVAQTAKTIMAKDLEAMSTD